MYSVKITKAEKLFVQSDGSTILAIDFDVLKDGEIEVHYSHGFALETPQEDINAYFKTFCEARAANAEKSAANAEFDAANKVADETINALVGAEITN